MESDKTTYVHLVVKSKELSWVVGPRGGCVFNVPRELVRSFGVIFIGNEFGHPVLQHGEKLYIFYM